MRWWNKPNLLRRGWIWGLFIVIAKTRSSASLINTSFSPSALVLSLSFPRCACGQGANAHRRSDLSHAAPAGDSAPSPVRLQPALQCLVPSRLLHGLSASTASQCLLQWDDRSTASILQQGETQWEFEVRLPDSFGYYFVKNSHHLSIFILTRPLKKVHFNVERFFPQETCWFTQQAQTPKVNCFLVIKCQTAVPVPYCPTNGGINTAQTESLFY